MFILSVGIMAVVSMFVTSIKANTMGRNVTVGNRLAQNLMEQVKTQTFNEAANKMCIAGSDITGCATVYGTTFVANDTVTRNGIFQEAASGNLNAVRYTVSMQQIENRPATGLNQITVTVNWSDAYGAHRTRLITYVEK
jgi:Tfp pilus assembly protein PilV